MKFGKRIALTAASALVALGAAAAVPSAAHAVTRPGALQTAAASSRSALLPGLVHVKQVPNNLGPGWTAVQWVAGTGDGGGCAIPYNDSNLEPIDSGPCGEWTFEEREIGTEPHYGPMIELVDPAGQFAVGFSGGHFKLEAPSTSPGGSFLVETAASGSNYCDYNSALTDVGGAAGKGADLKVSGTCTSADYWLAL